MHATLTQLAFIIGQELIFWGERYNVMTSNVVESLNAVLKEARELPIISLIEEEELKFKHINEIDYLMLRMEAIGTKESLGIPY